MYIISRSWIQPVDICDFYTVVVLNNKASTLLQRESVDNFFEKLIESDEDVSKKVEQILHFMRFQGSCSARMIYNLVQGDLENAGICISESDYNFLELSRKDTIHKYESIKNAALRAGAYSCSISGSGPSIFALTNNLEKAKRIRDSMLNVADKTNAKWLISPINKKGAKIIEDQDEWFNGNRQFHNFWE